MRKMDAKAARHDHAVTATDSFLQSLNHEIPEVNLQDHALRVDLNWSRPREKGSRFSGAVVGVDTLLIDERSFLDRVFLTFYHAWADGEGRTTTVQARYQGKNFRNESVRVNSHTLFGVPREDDGTTLLASLAYPIRKHRTLSLEYLRDRNKSNIALFDYVRNITFITCSIWVVPGSPSSS